MQLFVFVGIVLPIAIVAWAGAFILLGLLYQEWMDR